MLNRRTQRLTALALTGLLCAGFAATRSGAAPTAAGEYEVKAAYIVNFLMFVRPAGENAIPEAQQTIAVGILGEDPFGDSFAPVEGRPLGNTNCKLVVHRLKTLDTDTIFRCRAVFISRSEKNRLRTILDALRGRPVLTISDIDDFAQNGGMIGLELRKRRLRWIINRLSIERAGLHASAQLFRNALRVLDKLETADNKMED